MERENIVQKKSFDFALRIIELYKLMRAQKEFVLSRQLLRSGTSIGANVAEASAAQTKRDFIAKMAISSKEARETKYWLMLIKESGIVKVDVDAYLTQISDLINILTKIVKTSQEKLI